MESLTRSCVCSPAYGASIQSFNNLLDILRSKAEKLYPDKPLTYNILLGDMNVGENKSFYTANIEIKEKDKVLLKLDLPRVGKYADQTLLDTVLALIDLVKSETSKEKYLAIDINYNV